MKRAVRVPITVKCGIGIDDQDPEIALDMLARNVVAAGADAAAFDRQAFRRRVPWRARRARVPPSTRRERR